MEEEKGGEQKFRFQEMLLKHELVRLNAIALFKAKTVLYTRFKRIKRITQAVLYGNITCLSDPI